MSNDAIALARRNAVSASRKNLTQRLRRVISITTWHRDLISLFLVSYRENRYQQPRSCFLHRKLIKCQVNSLNLKFVAQILAWNAQITKHCLIFSPACLKFRLRFNRALHKVLINQNIYNAVLPKITSTRADQESVATSSITGSSESYDSYNWNWVVN